MRKHWIIAPSGIAPNPNPP